MKDFFAYQKEIPAGKGFELFDKGHKLWIAGIIFLVIVFSMWYSKIGRRQQERVSRVMSVCLLAGGAVRDVVLAVRGYFGVGFFPIHLCSMALFLAVIYSFTGNRYCGMVYLLLCIPGAVGALLFPNWHAYPFFSYMNIHAFVSHGFLLTFGIMQYAAGRLVPKWSDFWMPVSFGIIGAFAVYPFNRHFGTNFWFLNRPSGGSPLVFIAEFCGDKLYTPVYFFCCILIIAVWMSLLIALHGARIHLCGKAGRLTPAGK